MSKITINGNKEILGKLSVSRAADFSTNPITINIGGQLSTHRYVDEITTIETDRYKISGVSVFQESFGSEDFDILYLFTATKLVVKGGESHLKENKIKEIETSKYNTDGGVKSGQ